MLAILDEAYGRPPERPHGDAISELVLALLSQHTSDHNSGRAFHRLIERFPAWEDVIEAPTERGRGRDPAGRARTDEGAPATGAPRRGARPRTGL